MPSVKAPDSAVVLQMFCLTSLPDALASALSKCLSLLVVSIMIYNNFNPAVQYGLPQNLSTDGSDRLSQSQRTCKRCTSGTGSRLCNGETCPMTKFKSLQFDYLNEALFMEHKGSSSLVILLETGLSTSQERKNVHLHSG